MKIKLTSFLLFFLTSLLSWGQTPPKPNIILIYTDDLGYGDLSSYGATKIKTPNIDRIAREGLRFTNAHATSATCTPSRYSLLTGEYAWRKPGTGIAAGNASLIIDPQQLTLPDVLQKANYKTAVVGKWHLGLGPESGPDWNGEIKPGPLELGFNYAYILPATADRVPCVYVENHRIVNLNPKDPIQVSYTDPIGKEPTGKDNPELLKLKPSHGHNQAIVNGVSRIGYMAGGKAAQWIDEDMADVLTKKAVGFITENKAAPFFLYFATHDIHVPRVPHSRFVGKSGLGLRGDALLQLDWSTGEILKILDELNLTQNTLVIFTSDNGPVLDDGYVDEAVEKLNNHQPAGPLRGGKYSAFEAGTRVPLLVRWPGQVQPGVSEALVSQVDFLKSFAALVGQPVTEEQAPDSFNQLDALLGKNKLGRKYLIEQSLNNTLCLIQGNWKYIEPSDGPKINKNTQTELGNDPTPQLYNLQPDIGEKKNLAATNPAKLKELATLLNLIKRKTELLILSYKLKKYKI
ncbi:sulfatase family protein [Adhaeribacter pallidiroseus]|uniref:Cerebroside-sulfatase n=1 Tax=Adhaeribacter pallidiroseus TaxID=2072847 RepID=A0A369QAG8_9BACT|nr:arylsulfatase [Adhaeribacter pallidiroseus]RDC61694.1 Cerebroside-sulfatase [Adhaeribacter pallidiroseus]